VKRVLFLSYYFPPMGGAGVQRSVKFVRHLPELGYRPTVVTAPIAGADRWSPRDADLASELPPGLDIARISSPQPPAIGGARRRLERLLRTTSPFARWWMDGVAETAPRAGEFDLIYASMSPFETAPVAAGLSRELGIPWVADLRDPWALDEIAVYPSRIHRALERRRMAGVLSTSSAVIMNTDEAAGAARRLPKLAHVSVRAIPNGYDAADFEGPVAVQPDPAVLDIVHTGYLHTAMGLRHRSGGRVRRILGGAEPGVDFLSRSHVHLLRALEQLIAARPAARLELRLHLAGVLSPEDEAVIEQFAYPELVRTYGYLPHAESLTLVRSAGLLFLPMHDLPPGRRARIVPGKTYEYLASERPILAAMPDGDARDLVQAADRVELCRPADVDGMAAAVARELDRPAADRTRPADRRSLIAPYERRALTRRLAAVFDDVLDAADTTGDGRDREAAPPESRSVG